MNDVLLPPTLRDYEASWLGPDVLAGLTLVAVAVPEQMATARLANLPAIAGLYAFLAGSLVFAALGRSRQTSVGADSSIAPILAVGVAGVTAVGSPHYPELVSFLTVMVGALLIGVGLLRLGWVAEFLSAPVITGVLAGIGVEIVVRQLPVVLGTTGGGTTTIGRVARVVHQLGETNGWALAIAAAVLATILVVEKVNRRIPAALIGLVVSIVVVGAANLKGRGVTVLGTIHGGLPSFSMPAASWLDARHMVAPALTIAFICIAQTAATERAAQVPSARDFNQDLLAIGAGSVVAGLAGAFAVNSSPPRSEIVRASGGRSQLAGLTAAAVVLGVVLVATGLLKDLPQATLGGILLFVATRLLRVNDLRSIWRFDRLEFALTVTTVLAVALLGIEEGVVVAIALSLADRTRRAARPRDAVLGRVPGTDHWIPCDIGRPTEDVPGVIVYLMYAPLWYGNADYVRTRIHDIVDSARDPVHAVVLDADGMSDIDYTGAAALGGLAAELKQRGITTAIARASHLVHHDLKHSGLLADIGPEHIYASVEDAVATLGSDH
jgi:high affinity sulfate transporter 1